MKSSRGFVIFVFKETATTEISTTEDTLSLHDALPIYLAERGAAATTQERRRAQNARQLLRSEEHTSELQSPSVISYAVFCLNKKNNKFSRLVAAAVGSPGTQDLVVRKR